jgi:hypothetical protein
MLSRLSDLCSGRLPLSTAFWSYAVFWGFFINLAALVLSLLSVMAGPPGQETGPYWPIYLAVLAHILPIPFNGAVFVGVWRSAERPENSPLVAMAAKSAIAAWALVLVLAYLIIP